MCRERERERMTFQGHQTRNLENDAYISLGYWATECKCPTRNRKKKRGKERDGWGLGVCHTTSPSASPTNPVLFVQQLFLPLSLLGLSHNVLPFWGDFTETALSLSLSLTYAFCQCNFRWRERWSSKECTWRKWVGWVPPLNRSAVPRARKARTKRERKMEGVYLRILNALLVASNGSRCGEAQSTKSKKKKNSNGNWLRLVSCLTKVLENSLLLQLYSSQRFIFSHMTI